MTFSVKRVTLIIHSFFIIFCLPALAETGPAADSLKVPAPDVSELADLPEDPSIKHGLLPCGITCYFAPGGMSKGMTDFTLVQKMDPALGRDELVTISRSRFSREKGLEKFFARNGMHPSRKGYVTVRPGAVSYRVAGFSAAREEEALDSTLYYLSMIMRHSALEGQPSSSQAIIISGGYDYEKYLSKLKTLSLMIPRVEGGIPEPVYIWEKPASGSVSPVYEGGAASRIVLRLKAKRMPAKYMKSLLPVMSDKMAGELEWVLRSRLYPALRARRLLVDFSFEHIGSGDTFSDEEIVLTIRCARSIRGKVRDVLVTELNRLFTYGVSMEEFCYARDAGRFRLMKSATDIRNYNSENAERCVSSFLYGASLSSADTRIKWAYRDIPDTVRTRIFNSYVTAILDQACVRDSSLAPAPALLSRRVVRDSLSRYAPDEVVLTKKTLKSIKDEPEYITGGVKWVMPNGLNVVYCRKDGCGGMWWSFSSRGGRKWADPDFFSCIDGIKEDGFKNYMEALGITVNLRLNPVDVTLEGSAPSEKWDDALQILSALVNQKENARVFAPACYKLLVVVGEEPVASVKETIYRYSAVLGPGGAWTAGQPHYSPEEPSSVDYNGMYAPGPAAFGNGAVASVFSQMDISSWNNAVSRLAGIILKQRLDEAFCGHCCISEVSAAFTTFPVGMYYMDFGVTQLPAERFALGDTALSVTDSEIELVRVLEELSSKAVDSKTISYIKKDVLNMFSVNSGTPSYLVRIARDRYMDNKDLYTKFSDVISAITPETIRKFFAGLSLTLRDSPEQEL